VTTLMKLGPADVGRRLTLEEFLNGDYTPGHKYELIDGRLAVSPEARLTHEELRQWLLVKLVYYAGQHPDVIRFVTAGARVFIPGRAETTCPEPDLAAYRAFPSGHEIGEHDWEDMNPLLVVAILSEGTEEKHLVRNVRLYGQAPSIGEYQVVDPGSDPRQPTLIVRRRSGSRWRTRRVPFGETYRTNLLPGFELLVDPTR
jgi:Uma2 family endonuclease